MKKLLKTNIVLVDAENIDSRSILKVYPSIAYKNKIFVLFCTHSSMNSAQSQARYILENYNEIKVYIVCADTVYKNNADIALLNFYKNILSIARLKDYTLTGITVLTNDFRLKLNLGFISRIYNASVGILEENTIKTYQNYANDLISCEIPQTITSKARISVGNISLSAKPTIDIINDLVSNCLNPNSSITTPNGNVGKYFESNSYIERKLTKTDNLNELATIRFNIDYLIDVEEFGGNDEICDNKMLNLDDEDLVKLIIKINPIFNDEEILKFTPRREEAEMKLAKINFFQNNTENEQFLSNKIDISDINIDNEEPYNIKDANNLLNRCKQDLTLFYENDLFKIYKYNITNDLFILNEKVLYRCKEDDFLPIVKDEIDVEKIGYDMLASIKDSIKINIIYNELFEIKLNEVSTIAIVNKFDDSINPLNEHSVLYEVVKMLDEKFNKIIYNSIISQKYNNYPKAFELIPDIIENPNKEQDLYIKLNAIPSQQFKTNFRLSVIDNKDILIYEISDDYIFKATIKDGKFKLIDYNSIVKLLINIKPLHHI